MIFTADWKLYNNDDDELRLYSLAGDSPEWQDLTSSNQQVVNRLKKIRDEWNSSITTDYIGKSIEGVQ